MADTWPGPNDLFSDSGDEEKMLLWLQTNRQLSVYGVAQRVQTAGSGSGRQHGGQTVKGL